MEDARRDPLDAEFESVDGLLGEFFARRPGAPDGATGPSPVLADDFGPFRLLSLLGQGGMGQVFLAEQTAPVRRQVAIKVLRNGMDSQVLMARFAAELQVLARMNHDRIARVFDAGCSAQGRPYFVMEYVAGLPITEHCDVRRLSLERRLELFLQICDGLQHAHDNAVLHRDLKPSNILVADHGDEVGVKIIDFGLARVLDGAPDQRASYSRFGAVLGTPCYMSPEQANGSAALTAATDVYSLGVVLYQLLVGVPPFEGLDEQSPLVVQRRITCEQPPSPSQRLAGIGDRAMDVAERCSSDASRHLRRIRGDLDWLVLRALHKEPDCRYASARDLANDVRAFLDGRPITARAESNVGRLRRWLRHNPGLAGGIAIGALALLCSGLVILHAMGVRREAEERVESHSAALSGDPRLLADLVDPERLVRLPFEAQRTLLEVALQFHRRRITESRQQDPALRAETAAAHVEIGTALRKLGRSADARDALTKARAMLEELLSAKGDDGELRGQRGRALDGLSGLAREEGDPSAALALAQDALADLRFAMTNGRPLFRPALARAVGNLVSTLYDLGQNGAALRAADEHIALLAEVLVPAGEQASAAEVLAAHYSRGLALNGLRRLPEARDALAAAVALGEELARDRPLDRDARYLQVHCRLLLARLHQKIAGDRDEGPAGECGRAALAEARTLAAEHPGSPDYQDQVARSLYFLGELQRHAAAPAAALPLYREALEIALRLLRSAPTAPFVGTARCCLIGEAKVRVALGEREQVAADALRVPMEHPALRFAAAEVLGSLVRCDDTASAQARAAAAAYGDAALALLRQCDMASPSFVRMLVWSGELDALRDRADFNALVAAPDDAIDDREATVPVASQWLCGQTGEQLDRLVASGWRITDFSVESLQPPRFAAALVLNQGPYHGDTWWLADADAATVSTICRERGARVAAIAVLTPAPNLRVAAVLGSNRDVHGWLCEPAGTTPGLRARCRKNHARPVALTVTPTMPQRLATTMIGNHLWAFREWRLRSATDAEVLSAGGEGWRVTDLARLADGSLRCIETKARVEGQELLLGATEDLVRQRLATGLRVAAFGSFERDGVQRYDVVLLPNR